MPKFGFKNFNRTEYVGINIDSLQKLAEQKGISVINREVLIQHSLANANDLIKILGRGKLTTKLEVTADGFSASAIKAIESQGGKAIISEKK